MQVEQKPTNAPKKRGPKFKLVKKSNAQKCADYQARQREKLAALKIIAKVMK